jgi:hypothetical protein
VKFVDINGAHPGLLCRDKTRFALFFKLWCYNNKERGAKGKRKKRKKSERVRVMSGEIVDNHDAHSASSLLKEKNEQGYVFSCGYGALATEVNGSPLLAKADKKGEKRGKREQEGEEGRGRE